MMIGHYENSYSKIKLYLVVSSAVPANAQMPSMAVTLTPKTGGFATFYKQYHKS